MNNEPWLMGTLLTFIVAAVCAALILVSLKWYRPTVALSKWVSTAAAGLAIVGLFSFHMLTQGAEPVLDAAPADMELYKVAYWLQNEHPDFSLEQAKRLWAHAPSVDSKFAMGLAYLGARQPAAGLSILSEVEQQSTGSLYIKAADIKELLKPIHQANEADAASSDPEAAWQKSLEQMATRGVQLLEQSLSRAMDAQKKAALGQAAQLDPLRINYVIKEGAASDSQAHMQHIQDLYEQAADHPAEQPALKLELAKTAVYMGDSSTAIHLLTQLLQHYPSAQEPAVLLSDLLLTGENVQEPLLSQLPQYTEAKRRATKEQRKLLEEWAKEVKHGDEEAAKVVADRLHTIQSTLDITKHLAFSLLHSMPNLAHPEVSFLLSRYYYLTQDSEKAGEIIQHIAKRPNELTTPQQMFIQQLQTLPDDPGQMTPVERVKRHELTQDVYQSLKPLGGKRLQDIEQTVEERSFAVFMSEQLIQLNKARLRISSIQAAENGQIEMYVTTDQIDTLTNQNVQIHDNNVQIDDFKVEKLQESTYGQRNIMMVMDRSFSMQGERLATAKLSAQNFVEQHTLQENIGVIVFASTSQVLHPLTQDIDAVSKAIATVEAQGGTAIAPAFYTAIEQIADQSGERIIFMLSDGEDEVFSQAEIRATIIEKANENGITIFAIGFGAGYETLRDVAEATGGQYIAAAGLEDLLQSFAKVGKTLERTYKITYQLNPVTMGQHRVVVNGPHETRSTKTYRIGPDEETLEDEWSKQPDLDLERVEFAINKAVPSRIVASSTGTTKIQLHGVGLDQTRQLLLDRQTVTFSIKSAELLEFTVNNNMSIGIHEITLIHTGEKEALYNFSVTSSKAQSSRGFGYATIYGDFIEEKQGNIRFLGNTSIDRFLYDAQGEMNLVDNTLHFSGLLPKVSQTVIGLIAANVHDAANDLERKYPDDIAMSVQLDEKTFTIKRKGNAVKNIADRVTLSKFGMELAIVPQLTYVSKYGVDAGKLTSRAAFGGFSALTDILQYGDKDKAENELTKTLLGKWQRMLDIASMEASLEVGYEPETIAIAGSFPLKLKLGSLFSTKSVQAEVGYEFGTSNFDLGFSASDMNLGDKFMRFKLGDSGIDEFSIKVGWQRHIYPMAGEVTLKSSSGIQLGMTPLKGKEIKIGIDARSGFSAVLGTEISTSAEGPYMKVLDWLNKLKVVNIDKKTACLLCVYGEARAEGIGTEQWSVQGVYGSKILGFTLKEKSIYIDINELSLATTIEAINLEGRTKLLWRDRTYDGDMTLKVQGEVAVMGFEGHVVILVNYMHFDYSYFIADAQTWFGNPNVHIGANVKVFQS